MKPSSILVLGVLGVASLSGCRGRSAAVTSQSVAGVCTISEPGAFPSAGLAGYAEHVTPTAGGGFGVGSLAVAVTCVTDGADLDQVVLILPNLRRGERPAVGEYHVRVPDDSTLTRAQRLDPRLAWGRVRRGAETPLLYTAQAGIVVISRSEAGLLEGAYHLALAAADSGVSLPGARPELATRAAVDSTGRTPVHHTALAGAFLAPRKEADWRGR